MAYDNQVRSITISAHSFASSDKTVKIPCPSGMKLKLEDVQFSCTTTCAGDSSKPIIKAGKAGSLTSLASWNLGTTASGTALRARDDAASSITADWLATDEDMVVTLTAATGSGAAGVGDVTIEYRVG